MRTLVECAVPLASKLIPAALLNVKGFDTVNNHRIHTLLWGCKCMLKKATPEDQNLTVTTRPIRGGCVAPHLSYAHFRCIIQHKVRLLSNIYGPSANAFVNTLAEAISQYMGTRRMVGSMREYQNSGTNRVIGFAHEVVKGRTLWGQWFYCDDNAATWYVWFHLVRDLMRRATKDDRINVVDLGPSRSDAFTKLKMK